MRVCDVCKKELKYKNTVNIIVEEIEIGELNETFHYKDKYEICKECKRNIMKKIEVD
jgi:hypothetical protein